MTFVTADSCRTQLERLTRLLVSAFPGSTVYQHSNLQRISHDVLNNRVDAVLMEAESEMSGGISLVQMLRRQKPDLPVFLISRSDNFREKAEGAGASGCFVLPDGEEQLLDAIRSAKMKKLPAE